jgi:hypothetical protein
MGGMISILEKGLEYHFKYGLSSRSHLGAPFLCTEGGKISFLLPTTT